jgi:hypothetical protein
MRHGIPLEHVLIEIAPERVIRSAATPVNIWFCFFGDTFEIGGVSIRRRT